jgi:hypothetical protein
MTVLAARGAELKRGAAYGIVRQLFEGALTRALTRRPRRCEIAFASASLVRSSVAHGAAAPLEPPSGRARAAVGRSAAFGRAA